MNNLVDIQDELLHDYKVIDQLFYGWGNGFVWLYDDLADTATVGAARVWFDAEMGGREYIIVNNTVIYLDTIAEL